MSQEEPNRALAGQPRGRGITQITRRDMLHRMGIGLGGLSMAAWLAACGVTGEGNGGNGDGKEEKDTLTTNQLNGELNFANWPLYIDRAGKKRPTLEDFQKATGTKINYREVIQDNQSFFGQIREPLDAGQAIEWDLIVVTDWMIAKLARLDYLEQLDISKIPNFEANAGEIYKDPIYDPGNKHSVPWQSGITGIGYNPKLTGREISSFEDLFDPEFEGKVGMFTEMYDTMNLTLLGLGIQPEDATLDDVEAARDKLIEQRDAGIVRQYYGNEYADALVREDIALTMAWSGDIFQLKFDKPELEFVVPDEGGILWVDNLAIPQNAPNPIDAMQFMDFVYDPQIAAQITGWVNYICPVPAAKDLLIQQAEDEDDPYYKQVAESPLVFPTPEMEARLSHYKTLPEEEEAQWNDLFNEVIQG